MGTVAEWMQAAWGNLATAQSLQGPVAAASPVVAQGTNIMQFAVVAKVDPYLGLHTAADMASPVLRELKFNDRVFVRSELPGGWYFVITDDRQEGYIWKKKVFIGPPEPHAGLLQVDSNQSALSIARTCYSGDIADDADLRFYVNALVHVNKGEGDTSKGIYRRPGDEGDWEATRTTADKYIWIPSAPYALTLRGIVKSGGRGETVKGWFQAAAEFLVQFADGLMQGAQQSLRDMFRAAVELAEQMWALLQADLSDIAVAIYHWVSELTLDDVKAVLRQVVDRFEDFEAKWNNRNLYKAAHFQGYVIGYVLMDYVIGEVIGAALEVAARLPRITVQAFDGMAASRRLVQAAERLEVAEKVKLYVKEAKLEEGALAGSSRAAPATGAGNVEASAAGVAPVTPARTILGPPAPAKVVRPPTPTRPPASPAPTATVTGSVDPFAGVSNRKLRQLAIKDKDAAEALWNRYDSMSTKQLQEAARNGDGTAKTVLDRRIPENKKVEEFRGKKGEERPVPHEAGAKVTDPSGRVKWRDEYRSGGMTPEQKARPDWRAASQESHTERKAIVEAPLEPGETLWIRGQYDPCDPCQRAMRDASRGGRTVDYWWPGGHFRAVDGEIVIPVELTVKK
jgi:hypothetical protein